MLSVSLLESDRGDTRMRCISKVALPANLTPSYRCLYKHRITLTDYIKLLDERRCPGKKGHPCTTEHDSQANRSCDDIV